MIEAGFEFDSTIDQLLPVFSALSAPLRPTHFSIKESKAHPSDRLEAPSRLSAFVASHPSGFFLLGPGLTYSLRPTNGKPVVCDCFLEVDPEDALQLLMHMASARPTFGFACCREEREERNRVMAHRDHGTTEAWVGRDTSRYVPGLYWLTLLSDSLANRHGVSLHAIAEAAKERFDLPHGQHLYRFYERPEDWRSTRAVADLCRSLDGVFDVSTVAAQLPSAKTFAEVMSLLDKWN